MRDVRTPAFDPSGSRALPDCCRPVLQIMPAEFASLAPIPKQPRRRTGADQCERRGAGARPRRGFSREPSSALRTGTACAAPVAAGPAICSAPRISLGQIARVTPVIACAGFVRLRGTAADPGIARANDRRIAAARTGTCPTARVLERPLQRQLRASIWQFCLPIKCARIILHFGLYAAGARRQRPA
jgi:hypothetical protein